MAFHLRQSGAFTRPFGTAASDITERARNEPGFWRGMAIGFAAGTVVGGYAIERLIAWL